MLSASSAVKSAAKATSSRSNGPGSAPCDSARAACDAFLSAGIAAEYIDAHTGDDERDAVMSRVEAGFTKVVCNVGVMTEGWDSPCLSCCILLRLCGSYVLFIQAFRMGAEPFFFKQAGEANAPKVYARVMKFFVITCCFCFLGVVLFLDIWKHFMGIRKHPEYLEGLSVVPVLMLSRIFLGVYYNMSIWYKLTNRNLTGAWITIGGAIITILINYFLIPYFGFVACAISVTLCYGFMMVASYILGQKYYPVPYAWKKLTAYVVICVLLYLLHQLFRHFSPSIWFTHAFGLLELAAFMVLVVRVEKKEFIRIPVLGRILYPGAQASS
jgi:hypothetical protein